jgi:uridylate kinase
MALTTLEPSAPGSGRLFDGFEPLEPSGPTNIEAITMAQPMEGDKETSRNPRQLLKISGEFLRGEDRDDLINDEKCLRVATEVAEVLDSFAIGIVPGGGNIWRGERSRHPYMTDEQADYMGMMATLMNAQALEAAFIGLKVPVRVMSALRVAKVAEEVIHKRTLRHLNKGRVVIFACGTGNPHCTTDFAAALRAAEIKAVVLQKGSHGTVNGVHTANPRVFPDAAHIDDCSFDRAIRDNLEVMDPEAFALCRKKKRPIHVFSMEEPGSITRSLRGERVGSIVH